MLAVSGLKAHLMPSVDIKEPLELTRMVDPLQLLGFAFANADLLFEIDRKGKILFAAGATTGLADVSAEALIGHSATKLFSDADAKRFVSHSSTLSAGGRVGPMPLTLANSKKARLSLYRLPPNDGKISCTLIGDATPGLATRGGRDPETGLPDRDSFFAAASLTTSSKGMLAVLDVPGLPVAAAKLSAQDSQKLMSGIAASLTSTGASTVGGLYETAFGVIAETASVTKGLAANVALAIRENGGGDLKIEQTLVRLQGDGLSGDQALMAMRYVVHKLVNEKNGDRPDNLGEALNGMVTEAVGRATAFVQTVDDGAFTLVFEPIVNLKTGEVSHYEALTRFTEGQSPGELVAFAEEMGLATSFDIAVVLKVFAIVANNPKARFSIALNVSGATVGTPSAFALYSAIMERNKVHAKRVHVEITESSEMQDLVFADKATQTLRNMGYRVGLDDFGAGAASLQYVHALTVDFVKFDGKLTKRIGQSKRDDAVLKSLIATCESLDISVIGEWIENEEKFNYAKTLGFGYGQGRHFGMQLASLPPPQAPVTPAAPVRARRMGVQETWG